MTKNFEFTIDREKIKTNLKGFEEVKTGVSEDDPQLLPPVRVLELPQQVSAEHGLKGEVKLPLGEGRGAVPAHVNRGVGPLVARGRRQCLMMRLGTH